MIMDDIPEDLLVRIIAKQALWDMHKTELHKIVIDLTAIIQEKIPDVTIEEVTDMLEGVCYGTKN